MIRTIRENTALTVEERKSKFVTVAFFVTSTERAKQRLEEVAKQYRNANHYCYAYRILEKGKLLEKSSDAGEPKGTAGYPMLSVLKGNEVVNVLVVVARYFGGILLGTGRLARTYSLCVKNAIEQTEIVEKEIRLSDDSRSFLSRC